MSFFKRGAGDSDSDSDSSSEEELLSEEEAKPTTTASSFQPKKSRFARGSDSSSDSSSDEDDELEEDDEDEGKNQSAPKVSRFSRFAHGGSDSSESESEDEGKKVVKSVKSKRAEELEAGVKRVENAARINDWVTVNNEFDRITRLVATAPSNVLAIVSIPPTYLKLLSTLGGFIEGGSANNASHKRALSSLKQKVKKTAREHEALITKWKADPEAYERDFEGVPVTAPAPPKAKKPVAAAEAGAADEDFTTVGKGGKAVTITADNVLKTLQTVVEARGKKATDRTEQIKVLDKLLAVAATPYARIRVLLALISSLYDYNTSAHSYLPIEQWESARVRLEELFKTLENEPNYVIQEETEEYDELEDRQPKDGQVVYIRGSVLSLIERLDDEFTKSLKDIDPHAVEYVERLKDEKHVYQSLAISADYFEKSKSTESLDRIVMRRLDHVYGKPDAVITALESSLPPLSSSIWPSPSQTVPTKGNLVRALCVYLYKPQVDARLRSRAVLCHVFHKALHNEFYHARDMLLMSHVHQSAHNMDVDTQILYNRTIAQLGLSAFRNGLVEETEGLLRDLYTNPTLVKERLAQGMQRRGPDFAVSAEQEKLEKARQMPFHQHINLELLECAYLVSSMLIEVPQMALEEYDPERKRDIKSRMFRRQLDSFDKQIFAGPPENKREHVVQAAKALQIGDWKKCIELIDSIKVWSLMPGEKEVKAHLARKIQEEGLRTYLLSHANFYSTISLEYLAATFELPTDTVNAIVSSMIWNEQLAASLDAMSETLILHREARSGLEQMALALADKIGQALGENERTAAVKFGDGEQGNRDTRGDRRDQDGGHRRTGQGRTRGGKRHISGFGGNALGRAVKV